MTTKPRTEADQLNEEAAGMPASAIARQAFEDGRREAEPRTSDEWRAFFRERGWSIEMDDREGQAFDPFVHIAAAHAAGRASALGVDSELRTALRDALEHHFEYDHRADMEPDVCARVITDALHGAGVLTPATDSLPDSIDALDWERLWTVVMQHVGIVYAHEHELAETCGEVLAREYADNLALHPVEAKKGAPDAE